MAVLWGLILSPNNKRPQFPNHQIMVNGHSNIAEYNFLHICYEWGWVSRGRGF